MKIKKTVHTYEYKQEHQIQNLNNTALDKDMNTILCRQIAFVSFKDGIRSTAKSLTSLNKINKNHFLKNNIFDSTLPDKQYPYMVCDYDFLHKAIEHALKDRKKVSFYLLTPNHAMTIEAKIKRGKACLKYYDPNKTNSFTKIVDDTNNWKKVIEAFNQKPESAINYSCGTNTISMAPKKIQKERTLTYAWTNNLQETLVWTMRQSDKEGFEKILRLIEAHKAQKPTLEQKTFFRTTLNHLSIEEKVFYLDKIRKTEHAKTAFNIR